MIERLFIKNFALINDLEINFSNGFNVMTGETGAGKTIIVEAINLVCGERSRQEFIRTGCDMAIIEAEFSINNNKKILEVLNNLNLTQEDGIIIIRREIGVSGKNRCLVNGHQITLSMLKILGDKLVDIHGQHEHQSLLLPENHLDVLDNLAKITSDVLKMNQLYQSYKDIEEKIKQLENSKRERLSKIDFLEFQLKEIESANLTQGEDDELEQRACILRNAEKLTGSVSKACNLLSEIDDPPSAMQLLGNIKQELESITTIDPNIKDSYNLCANALIELKELNSNLTSYRDSIEFNPELQTKIEDRINAILNLKKKYGKTIPEIFTYQDKIKNDLNELLNAEEIFGNYQEELNKIKKNINETASLLSQKRIQAAKTIKSKVEHELQDLGMNKTKFVVNIDKEEALSGEMLIDGKSYRLFPWGMDKVEFFISPNPGEDPKPLAKIASGGEISRIMLALKTINTQIDNVPTVIFDEIDVGVGGTMASKIGQKLKKLSSNFQVISITHLPQIASLANTHFSISKKVKGERTITEVEQLDTNSRIKEIARMLAGEKITELTLKHAQELMNE
ncbi:DNA repair protein RecN [Candidatus Poribacteria bacterium]|nr:DNA repair protein RecN [Candidatus Poribacteria bacterium]